LPELRKHLLQRFDFHGLFLARAFYF